MPYARTGIVDEPMNYSFVLLVGMIIIFWLIKVSVMMSSKLNLVKHLYTAVCYFI